MLSTMTVEVVRSGMVESRHQARLVLLDADGAVERSWGQVGEPVFPRSALKPLQAAGMLQAGLRATGAALAIACSSHDGSESQVAVVRQLLSEAGLTERCLRCPPALPESAQEQEWYVRRGGERDTVHHECSGKHAAMIATCSGAGWPVESYLSTSHPLQVAIKDRVEALSSERVAAIGVDGCGAPVHAISLTGLARAYSRLAVAAPGTNESLVATAMRAHPELVAGPDRDITQMMEAVPSLIAKDGAEAVYAAALPDGRAAALKVEDGGLRAATPLLCAVLTYWGFANRAVAQLAEPQVLGGGRQVGVIRVDGNGLTPARSRSEASAVDELKGRTL